MLLASMALLLLLLLLLLFRFPSSRLVFIIRMLSLMDNTKAFGFLHERSLIPFTQQPETNSANQRHLKLAPSFEMTLPRRRRRGGAPIG